MHMKKPVVAREQSLVTPAKKMINVLELLSDRTGKYSGEGIYDFEDKFKGYLELKSIIDNYGIQIKYKMIGDGNEKYHEENTLIALNGDNIVTLWTLNSDFHTNISFEIKDHKRAADKETIIFGFSEAGHDDNFREEIIIDLYDNGEVGYNYFWGLPNGEFLSRSNCILKKEDN